MKKLIQGIIEFRETRRQHLAPTFERLALGQKPDALFIACSDSRVAANVFASTDPGDLFVLRNVGNLVPPFGHPGGTGTAAGVDYAVEVLKVRNIIVCGHSDCGAMQALCAPPGSLPDGALKQWLGMGAPAEARALEVNEASRRNTLAQLEHLRDYPSVARAMREDKLGLHALWFDIHSMDVFYFEPEPGQWTVLDAEEGKRIIERLER
jgi:carbonic anhydrase